MGLLKRFAYGFHAGLARGPHWLAVAYLWMLSLISRNLLPPSVGRRVQNSICGYGHPWPLLPLAPRRVRMGRRTYVSFVPHLSGFERDALFMRQFNYELPLVRWLEDNVASTYDVVIEIGSNVGIHTVLLDALYRAAQPPAGTDKPRVISFEPSPRAFERLQANLAANDARFVSAHRMAIGTTSGQQTLYEPRGHLTNGTFVRDFARIFSGDIVEIPVETMAASELEQWLAPARRALLKIDVEGFEAPLLEALAPLIDKYHPDLVIEVLPFSLASLQTSRPLAGYERYLLTPSGPQRSPSLYAAPGHFDWLLRWPRGEAA